MTGLRSCLYEGMVWHERWRPVRHRFRYRLFFLYLDLAELDRVFDGRLFWSCRRPALARFRRSDHYGDPELSLDEAIRGLVARKLGSRPTGPVRLLTHPSYFGYCFNPVSIYYCFDSAGERVESAVVEVSNTPWGEQHCYVLGAGQVAGPVLAQRLAKEFHVSPFMDMELQYAWRIGAPGNSLEVEMTNSDGAGQFFDARLRLDRVPITGANLARVLVRYPFMTAKVVSAIYWQALRLLLKGAPFFPHPDKRPRK